MKKYKVIKLMTLAFEAGLESKETDIIVNWIYTKHVNENNK